MWFANKFLVYSLIASIILQLVIVYSPLGSYFKVVSLGLYEWAVLLIGTAAGFYFGILVAKLINKLMAEEH
jgi:magnesium-transporting ATPase (P-type)